MFTDYYGLAFNPFDKQRVKEKDCFQSRDFKEMASRLSYVREVRDRCVHGTARYG